MIGTVVPTQKQFESMTAPYPHILGRCEVPAAFSPEQKRAFFAFLAANPDQRQEEHRWMFVLRDAVLMGQLRVEDLTNFNPLNERCFNVLTAAGHSQFMIGLLNMRGAVNMAAAMFECGYC